MVWYGVLALCIVSFGFGLILGIMVTCRCFEKKWDETTPSEHKTFELKKEIDLTEKKIIDSKNKIQQLELQNKLRQGNFKLREIQAKEKFIKQLNKANYIAKQKLLMLEKHKKEDIRLKKQLVNSNNRKKRNY